MRALCRGTHASACVVHDTLMFVSQNVRSLAEEDSCCRYRTGRLSRVVVLHCGGSTNEKPGSYSWFSSSNARCRDTVRVSRFVSRRSWVPLRLAIAFVPPSLNREYILECSLQNSTGATSAALDLNFPNARKLASEYSRCSRLKLDVSSHWTAMSPSSPTRSSLCM